MRSLAKLTTERTKSTKITECWGKKASGTLSHNLCIPIGLSTPERGNDSEMRGRVEFLQVSPSSSTQG